MGPPPLSSSEGTTADNKITWLYTTVGFHDSKNVGFMFNELSSNLIELKAWVTQ
jgi:hypothetical protein